MSKPCPICGKDTNDLVCVICKLDPLMKDKVIEIRTAAKKKKYKKSNPDYVCIEGCGTIVQVPGLKCDNCLPEAFKICPDEKKEDKAMSPQKKEKGPKKVKGNHSTCEVEQCNKYSVKDKRCHSHYKEKHGVAPYSQASEKKDKKKRKYTKKFDTAKMLANHPEPEPIKRETPSGLSGIKDSLSYSVQTIKTELKKIEALI